MSLRTALVHEMFRLCRKYVPGRAYRLRDRVFRACNIRIRAIVPIDGIYHQIDTHNYHERGVFCFGKYEIGTTDFITQFLTRVPAGVVIDVGANIGLHTLRMAAATATKDVLVLAFEANPEMVQRLRRNVALNAFTNVRVYQLGLNDREGIVELGLPYREEQDSYHNPGIASMTNMSRAVRSIAVTCKTLDSVLIDDGIGCSSVRLLKLDVEGKELEVLKGADAVLRESAPPIIVEFNKANFSDIDRLLTAYGYSRVGSLVRYGIDVDTLQENILFVKPAA